MSAYQHYQYEEFLSTKDGVNISVGVAASAGVALQPGSYECISTTDCWVKRGASNVAAVAEGLDSHYRPAWFMWRVTVREEDRKNGVNYFSSIRSTADGTLYVRSASR